jgi:hypothetical protein
MVDELARNLARFNLAIEEAVREIPPQLVKTVTKKLALEVLRGVVKLTPVETGRAQGNWQMEIDNVPEGETGIEDKSEDGAPTIARGLQALASLQPFQTVFITNNVPYIGFLENGTEKMAPVGMVSRTLARLAGAQT